MTAARRELSGRDTVTDRRRRNMNLNPVASTFDCQLVYMENYWSTINNNKPGRVRGRGHSPDGKCSALDSSSDDIPMNGRTINETMTDLDGLND